MRSGRGNWVPNKGVGGKAKCDFSGQLAPRTLTAAVHGQRTAGSEQWEAQSQSRGDQNTHTHRASIGHWAAQTLTTASNDLR